MYINTHLCNDPSNMVDKDEGKIFHSITIKFFCPRLHQCNEMVNFTGNVIIINYPKHFFSALCSYIYADTDISVIGQYWPINSIISIISRMIYRLRYMG